MIAFDWHALILGLTVGAVMSALFFIGLSMGLKRALRTRTPIRILTLSAVVRIAVLLAIGWVVVERGGAWAMLGYAGAFLAARYVATTFVRGEVR